MARPFFAKGKIDRKRERPSAAATGGGRCCSCRLRGRERSRRRAISTAISIILDLEDSVVVEDRDSARAAAIEAVRAGFNGKPVAIRINAEDRPEHGPDMVAVRAADPDYVIVPKVIDARQAHDAYLVTKLPVIPMIESPAGIVNAQRIAKEPGVVALLAGTNDLRRGLRMCRPTRRVRPFLRAPVDRARRARPASPASTACYNHLEDQVGSGARLRGRAANGVRRQVDHPSEPHRHHQRRLSPKETIVAQARALIEAYTGRRAAATTGA